MLALYNFGSHVFSSYTPALLHAFTIDTYNEWPSGIAELTRKPWQLPVILQAAKEIEVSYTITGAVFSHSDTVTLARKSWPSEEIITTLSQALYWRQHSGWLINESIPFEEPEGSLEINFGASGGSLWSPDTLEWAATAGMTVVEYYQIPIEEPEEGGPDATFYQNAIIGGHEVTSDDSSPSAFGISLDEFTGPYRYSLNSDNGYPPGVDITGSCSITVTSWLDWE